MSMAKVFNPLLKLGFDDKGSGAGVGSPVSGGTSGSVLFVDSSGNLAQHNPGFKYTESAGLDILNKAIIQNSATDTKTLVVKGANGNTEHIFSVQDGSGFEIFWVQGGGIERRVNVAGNTFAVPSDFIISGSSAGSPGLQFSGSGHSINSYDSTALVLNSLGNDIVSTHASTQWGVYTPTPVGQFDVTSGDASRKGVIIKGAASQSANLQEWQNSSGTVLSSVASDGSINIGGVYATSGMDFLYSAEVGFIANRNGEVRIYGSNVHMLTVGVAEVVVNETGRDTDFRIEGDTISTLFVVDAGLDQVQIGNHVKLASVAGITTEGTMWNDSTQKAVQIYEDGIEQTLSSIIFVATANATANSATETSIIGTGVGTTTLPANFFVAGKTLRIRVWGFATDSIMNGAFEIKLKLGSTVIATTGSIQLPASSSTTPWELTADITCRTTGASGTVFSNGSMAIQDNATSSTTPYVFWLANTSADTIDTTGALAVGLTSTSSNDGMDEYASLTSTNFSLEVLN